MKEYKNFIFKIRSYKLIEIYVEGLLVKENDLIESNVWDKLQNVLSLLNFKVKVWSKSKGRYVFIYPYQFPLIFPDVDMDEEEYQKYITKVNSKINDYKIH